MAADAPVNQARIDVVVIGAEALLCPHGELDMFSVGYLQAALAGVAKASRVLVDLSDVSFVDSAVLRCLALSAQERAARGRQLRIDNPQAIVRRLMVLLRLDDLHAV